jgi:hypothetical protein
MSEVRKTINHSALGTVRAYARETEGRIVVLDVERDGEVLPRSEWMSDYHDELADHIEKTLG